MSESYLGQIIVGGWNFAPRGFALCNGQLLSIQQNAALFSLLGTTYGGNGTTNFQLPNLQGRSMVHWGNGAGLSPIVVGEQAGAENATLNTNNLPAHTHTFDGSASTLNASGPQPHASANVPLTGYVLGHSVDIHSPPTSEPAIYCPSGTATSVALGGLNVAGTLSLTGGNQPFGIRSPYLALTMVIALTGIFPSRN